ncbi:MAG: hypothetical protein FJW35_18115 [Acidobacteria bacterium]|nr:hypothetical protein [Acidobacteriota bacterium]
MKGESRNRDRRFSPTLMIVGLLRDLRQAGRQLGRRPGFSLFVVLTLAAGTGPSVAIFSVLKALVLQPFYYPEPDRLVQVWQTGISPLHPLYLSGGALFELLVAMAASVIPCLRGSRVDPVQALRTG